MQPVDNCTVFTKTEQQVGYIFLEMRERKQSNITSDTLYVNSEKENWLTIQKRYLLAPDVRKGCQQQKRKASYFLFILFF